MKKRTYLQVLKQIDDLKMEAERLRRAESAGVVDRIRDAISRYGLTAGDLGLGSAGAGPARKKPGPKPGRRAKKTSLAGRKVAPKFRDEAGNTWAGRGKRPRWLNSALASGRKLEDFAVK